MGFLLWTAWLGVAQGADALPVRRIRFYETGVGWFERAGIVEGTRAQLPLPTAYLDDVLKSLVVLEGDARLDALTYPSAPGADAARADAGLDPEAGGPIGYEDALFALRGLEVVVARDGAQLEGVLLDVEGPLPTPSAVDGPTPDPRAPVHVLTVLDSDGALHRVLTTEVRSVRAAAEDATDRLRIAAESQVANRAQRTRPVGLQVSRSGRIGVGYLAEAPVWRMSYRLHEPGEGARLEGWALIHNTTSEPWDDVRVELANGEPDSFLFPLTAPRFADRDLIVPERPLATVAQLATSSADDMWKVSRGLSRASGMGYGGFGASGSGSGSGASVVHGEPVVMGAPTPPPIETPSQFVYVAPRPVDLPAHHSAAVPILEVDVHAEEGVWLLTGGCRNAVWMRNDTEQTLPAGVMSVVQARGLAGEARLPRLKPTESRMLAIANQPDVSVTSRREEQVGAATDVSWSDREELLTVHGSTEVVWTADIRNRTGREVTAWLQVDVPGEAAPPTGARLLADDRTGDAFVAWSVPPGAHEMQATFELPRSRSHALDGLSLSEWEGFRDAGVLDRPTADALVRLRADLARVDDLLQDNGSDTSRLERELQGLRKSLAAAGDDAAPLTRRASTVQQQISKLGAARARLAEERVEVLEAMAEALRRAGGDAGR